MRVVKGTELDTNTAQTPGMNRAAAITHARAGAEKLWAGTVVIHPKAKTGAHHHGPLESVIYVVSGKARMRWGDSPRIHRRSGAGRLHLRPALCAAPGDQRERRGAAVLRAGAQRTGARRGQPGYSGGREAGGSALGGQHPPRSCGHPKPAAEKRSAAIARGPIRAGRLQPVLELSDVRGQRVAGVLDIGPKRLLCRLDPGSEPGVGIAAERAQ